MKQHHGPIYSGPIAFCALVLFLAAGCAEVGNPPGGEVDRTAPFLLTSIPANGELGVQPSDEIRLRFSERITQPSNSKSVFISPRPTLEPRVKWKGDEIIIKLQEVFRPDQTYIVSVNTAVTDLRNNPLDSAVTIAFSTGTQIDSGRAGGRVWQQESPVSGMVMGLYRTAALSDSVPYDSLYPDYVTTTTKEGLFDFRYLPNGAYRLIGFMDKNRDERFNPGRESFALTDREVTIGGPLPFTDLMMSVTSYDSLRSEVLSATVRPGNLIRLRLSKAIGLDFVCESPDNLMLRPIDDTLTGYPVAGLLESDLPESSILTAFFDSLKVGSYLLQLKYDPDLPVLIYEPLNVEPREDKEQPHIDNFTPGQKAYFVNQVKMGLTFSEPLDTARITPQTFMFWQGEETPVLLERVWSDPFHLQLKPEQLLAGQKYRLDIAQFDLADRAGNLVGDSLTVYGFSTLDTDSLGSISGEVKISLTDRNESPVILKFKHTGGKGSYNLTSHDRRFAIDLPAGQYILSGFIDQDANGEFSPGTIIPFRPAETQAVYPDTIGVRARFETAGIEFEFK